ncbi:MAG: folylpolyglutamate synthase/dihydrofolate synthase family protein [Syntrophales bacterium]|jgi:dihydrofolate synthase/folylpolyglutamate synthase|nr:folylpolyglutamate synthase/dihydrofolate synthase family protein [Syntrophales bacterium]
MPHHIMNDEDTRTYLIGLGDNGIRYDLVPFKHLLSKLNRPHKAYDTILVGGTNGKGSIASMIASILIRAGYKVGLYTSPHLVDARERIQVNGDMISPKELNRCVAEIRAVEEPGTTYFECLTAAAFVYFRAKQVDLAVLEVGMGGRLDATNVVDPLISVISNVGLEHTNYLGRTLQDIAREKAGIIREKGLCLTGARQKIVRQTLLRRCQDLGATLLELGKDFKIRRTTGGTFSYQSLKWHMRNLRTVLTGDHQIRNAALAIASVEALTTRGYVLKKEHIPAGLGSVKWPGRLEMVQSRPTVLLDGAHNPAAISALVYALRQSYSWRRLIVVFAVLSDKKYREMIRRLCVLADEMIITLPNAERAVSPIQLLPIAALHCPQVKIVLPAGEALRKAVANAGEDDLVCVCGSLYLIGEMKGWLASCLS